MPASIYVIFHEEADEFRLRWIGMIASHFEDNDGGTIFTRTVLAWPSESIYVNHTTVPPRHDGEPCFEISAQNLMLSCGMRIQVPSGAERFGHRSLSEGQVLLYKAVHKEFISKCKGIARRGRYHYALQYGADADKGFGMSRTAARMRAGSIRMAWAGCGGLEEVDGEDGDERLQRVAEAGMHGDDVIGDGEQQEGAGEESGGGNAAAQHEH